MWVSLCEFVHMSAVQQRPEEGIGFPQTRVRDGCQPPDVGADSGPLQELHALLTAEPSFWTWPFVKSLYTTTSN